MLETTITHRFADRHAAGRELADRLSSLNLRHPLVLGLPPDGVPVAYEIARALGTPLAVLVVGKIAVPGSRELGIGAIAAGGTCVLDLDAVRHLRVSADELEAAIVRATSELDADVQRHRNALLPSDLKGRTAIVVDDGLADGATARAALRAARARNPSRLVLAVPVGESETVQSLRQDADEVLCLFEANPMLAVGLWYEHFEPIPDAEIAQLLDGDAAGRF